MAHPIGVFDQRFDSAQRFGQHVELHRFENVLGGWASAFDLKTHHRAETVLLSLGQFVMRMSWQAGVMDGSDIRMRVEHFRDRLGTSLMRFHSRGQSLDAAKDEPRIKRRARKAQRVDKK